MYKQKPGTFTRTLEPGIVLRAKFENDLVELAIIDVEDDGITRATSVMSKIVFTREQWEDAMPFMEWATGQSEVFDLPDLTPTRSTDG